MARCPLNYAHVLASVHPPVLSRAGAKNTHKNQPACEFGIRTFGSYGNDGLVYSLASMDAFLSFSMGSHELSRRSGINTVPIHIGMHVHEMAMAELKEG